QDPVAHRLAPLQAGQRARLVLLRCTDGALRPEPLALLQLLELAGRLLLAGAHAAELHLCRGNAPALLADGRPDEGVVVLDLADSAVELRVDRGGYAFEERHVRPPWVNGRGAVLAAVQCTATFSSKVATHFTVGLLFVDLSAGSEGACPRRRGWSGS